MRDMLTQRATWRLMVAAVITQLFIRINSAIDSLLILGCPETIAPVAISINSTEPSRLVLMAAHTLLVRTVIIFLHSSSASNMVYGYGHCCK